MFFSCCCLKTNICYYSHIDADADKLEAEIKSDVSSEIQNIIPNIDAVKASVNGLLDAQVGQSGMTFRDVLAKSIEV